MRSAKAGCSIAAPQSAALAALVTVGPGPSRSGAVGYAGGDWYCVDAGTPPPQSIGCALVASLSPALTPCGRRVAVRPSQNPIAGGAESMRRSADCPGAS